MKTAEFGNTGGMALIKASWQEQAAYLYCMTLENMSEQGIVIQQIDSTDIASAESLTETLSVQLSSWFDDAIAANIAGNDIPSLDEQYIPELIEFLALAVTGQWGLIFVLFVKVGLKFLLERLKKQLNSTNSVDDLVGSLDSIFWDRSDPENPVSRLDGVGSVPDALQVLINTNPESLPFEDWNIM